MGSGADAVCAKQVREDITLMSAADITFFSIFLLLASGNSTIVTRDYKINTVCRSRNFLKTLTTYRSPLMSFRRIDVKRAKLFWFFALHKSLRMFVGTVGSCPHSGYGANRYRDVLLKTSIFQIVFFKRRI